MATNENPCTDCAACGGCESTDIDSDHERSESGGGTDGEEDQHAVRENARRSS